MLMGIWGKGNLLKTDLATMESIMKISQKIKIELAYDPAVQFWEYMKRKQKY